ncbi:hypothetical protein ACFYNZ_22945 [Streptomyces kebangsaanensis]|uniref:Uncharacterized protein n=1 Tax=Streptomyces kebangsaanensis TaxID=864058 RepID=A0ABW6KWM3_9ACTN
MALTATGLWWALAHSGCVRVTGALLAVLVPVAVLVLFATHRMLWSACLSLGLWGLALAAARIAMTPADPAPGHGREPGPVPVTARASG